MPNSLYFDLAPAFKEDVNKIVESLNAEKSTGSYWYHKGWYIASYFSDGAKKTLVRPFDEK